MFPHGEENLHCKQFEIRYTKPVLRTFVERYLNFYAVEDKAGSRDFDLGNLERVDEEDGRSG